MDLTDAVSLQTIAYQSGPLATRNLVFWNAEHDVVATIPTFFLSNQGCAAEPFAKELAECLELTFIPSLEPWEYDKELRKEHDKEVALTEKAARKKKFQQLKRKLLRMVKADVPAHTIPEDDETTEYFEEVSDGINYDAQDDQK